MSQTDSRRSGTRRYSTSKFNSQRGNALERDYQGKKLRAKILDDGTISFRGKTYTSLSKAALAATGTIWNGFVFWNLSKRTTKSTDQTTA